MENMEQIEDLVAEEVTENVEQTTEETVTEPAKMFTQDDLNAAVGKAKARERAKIEKQYKKLYGGLTDVLKAGTGKETVEEMTDTFKQFYQNKGVQFSQEPAYSEEDIALLEKLKSRKFWAAVLGVAVGVGLAFGVDGDSITAVAGAVTALVSVVTYIRTEGKIDAEAITVTVEAIQGAVKDFAEAEQE